MLQLLVILATLASLPSCSFFSSEVGQDILAGEEKVVETAIKEVLAPKATAPAPAAKK